MRNNTGEELDIVYTTDSLLVATPKDSHTSVMITRLDDELPCAVPVSEAFKFSEVIAIFLIQSTFLFLMLVDGYVFVVHLMFKKLHTVMGKLLMLHSFLVILMMSTAFIFSMMVSSPRADSLPLSSILCTGVC